MKKAAGPLIFAALFLASVMGRVTPFSLQNSAPDLITAEIKGAVVNPGVYTVKNGACVKDLIQEAGGEKENADLSAISLQDLLHPGQVIVIGKLAMDGNSPLISINTAPLEELTNLPGIGEAMAQRIVEYRSSKAFEKLEDLMEVKGIGEKKFAKLKDFIAL